MTDPQPTPPAASEVGRTILRNTLFITGGSVMLKALNFLFGILVVRQLGDDRFGQFNIVSAWVGLFAIFAEWGVSQYVMREIARDRAQTRPLFWNLVAVRLLLAMLGIVGITAGAAAVGYPAEIVWGVLFYTFTFVLSAVKVAFESVLAANERLDYTTAMVIIGQVAYIVLAGAVLLADLGLIAFIATGLLAMLPPIVFAVWALRRHHLLEWRPHVTPGLWLTMMRGGAPFAMISLALTIAYSIDTVMLSWVVPENQVGWYNVAYALTMSVMNFLTGFSVAMVPSLSRMYASDPAYIERWYARSIKFLGLLALPVAMGATLIAFPLFEFLYKPSTLPAALVLQVIIWDLPFLMFNAYCGNMTTVIGAERDAARIYSINAVANILLNLYAIPRYGIIGAALVTVVTDVVGALQFHFSLSRRLRLPSLRGILLRIGLATAGMGLAVAAAGQLHFVVLIGLGVVVYGGAVLALRLLDAEEWAMVNRLLARFVRRRTPAGPTV